MNFNRHSDLVGQHAFLSASKYHWLNYDDAKLLESYRSYKAAARGTELHEFAAQCIRLKQKLKSSKKTLDLYVNDAISYGMTPEQVLYYSPNCYGTADTISFSNKTGLLRIHDLKTGVIPAHMNQLEIYAALFCLEYEYNPVDLQMELRIYQNDEVLIHNPDPHQLDDICYKIIEFDKLIEQVKREENG